eukprot:TRINITY_DN3480_c0_g1_i2.p1 TRINITY_DN3480_c0_g1~~TRINITY_DN3480_c0_g1_i2.p1  ORF type:complete len:136 (-),score=52.81 TRINITY_DN3480_c0_g1_i2:102-509(-)
MQQGRSAAVCLWVNDQIVNDGSLPMDSHQEACLWHGWMVMKVPWRYVDDEQETVTIANLLDLQEAIHQCVQAQCTVLHIRTQQQQGPQVPRKLLTGYRSVGLSEYRSVPVSYTHLRAHETVLDLVCRLLLEKKKK